MNKYLILVVVLALVSLSFFLYNSGYFPVGDSPAADGKKEIPNIYPEYLFPVYNNSIITEVIEGEEESITISFLSKDSKEELKSYYSDLLTDAYQISEENNSKKYNSMGMKNDYIYNVSVSSSRTKYNDETYKTFTTIGVMPLDDEFKQDMDEMTEKEKEIMLIWFKAMIKMDK